MRLDAVIELAAEAAADGVADDADIGRSDAEKLRHPIAQIERELMAGMDDVAPGAVDRDGAFGLEIGLVLALAGEDVLDGERRRFKYRVDAAGIGAAFGGDIAAPRKIAARRRHIILPLGMDQGGVGPGGGFEVEQRRARLYLHFDRRRGGARLGQAVRRDGGDGLADIAHPLAREQRRVAHAPAGQHRRHVGGGDRRAHARHGARLAEIAAQQLSRRIRRTHQHAIEHARLFIIVSVDRLAVYLAPGVGAYCRAADMAHEAGASSWTAPNTASTIWA